MTNNSGSILAVNDLARSAKRLAPNNLLISFTIALRLGAHGRICHQAYPVGTPLLYTYICGNSCTATVFASQLFCGGMALELPRC